MNLSHSILAVSLLALVASAPALAQDQPQRHLVYNFTLGMQNDTHVTESQVRYENAPGPGAPVGSLNPGAAAGGGDARIVTGTGDTQYHGVASDTGTISVDVHGLRPDGGLQVEVSEAGRNYRKAAPMVCAVYPTTKVACAGDIFPEEAAVLSTLSPTFFDPARLDAKNHWQDSNDIPGLTLDFTAAAPKGSVVSISEQKKQNFSGGLGGDVVGNATFDYDTTRRVTTNLKAYETVRPQQGEPGQYSNIVVDITATLATDSGTTAKN
jgi:hypothetical protein